MAYSSKGLLVCLGVVAGCFIAVCALLPTAPPAAKSPATSAKPPAESPPPLRKFKIYDLKLRGRTDGSLSAGEAHRYSFHLAAGQFLAARVQQDPVPRHGVDVLVRLFAPVGGKLFEIDSPTGAMGAEEIHLLAERTGWHQAEVDGSGKPGTYRIQVQSIRQATSRDRDLFRVDRIFHRARVEKNCLRAVPEFLEAERLARRLGRLKLRAEALGRAGDCFYRHGKIREALPLQTKAFDLYRKLGDGSYQLVLLNSLGDSYHRLGQIDLAERSYRHGLSLSQELGEEESEATFWQQLGTVLLQKGELWNAIKACEKSLPYWERKGKWRPAVMVLLTLGKIYDSTGEYRLALDRYQQAERIIPTRQADDLRAQIFTRYAEVLYRMGKPEPARPYLIQALALRRNVKNLRGLGISLNFLGVVHQKLGRFQEAGQNLREALEIFRRIQDPREAAAAYINLGLLSLAEELPYEALDYFQRGLDLSRRLKFREGEAVALYGLAYAERMRLNLFNARAFSREVLVLVESLRKEAVRDDLKALFLEAKLNGYDLLIDVLITSPPSYTPPADVALSFETSERRRARSLLESLAFSGWWSKIQEKADPQLLNLLQRIDEEIDRRAEERRRLKDSGLPTEEVDVMIRSLLDQCRSVEAKIQDADRSLSSPNRREPVTLSEAQELLDENTLLLEYSLGRKRSFLWLVTPSSAKVFILPSRDQIEHQARKVYRLLQESQSQLGGAQALEAARALSETILKPVAKFLGNKRLVIVADGALHYVPFAFLPDPTRKWSPAGWRIHKPPPYLIANHEVVNLPSASVLRELRAVGSKRVAPPGLLAIVTNPVFARFAPLRQSARVTRAILDQVPPDEEVLTLEGSMASREMVTSGRLSGFRIVHFTTHGVIDTEIPELSGIVLSHKGTKDDYLRVRDVQRLTLRADLVVLAACNMARGKVMRGEGLVGLTHRFMHAGASSVVVSLWNVNEDSTPTFMRHFYHALLSEGRSPSAALRSAQLAMIQDPQWSLPYYWSGFIIQGEWR